MDAASRQGVQIDRSGGHQGLAFTGSHLGDPSGIQDHAADQLDIVVTLPERAFRGLANGCESGNQQIVQRSSVLVLLSELTGSGAQRVVRKSLYFRFERVDLLNRCPE